LTSSPPIRVNHQSGRHHRVRQTTRAIQQFCSLTPRSIKGRSAAQAEALTDSECSSEDDRDSSDDESDSGLPKVKMKGHR
jgi:hypothetical protein